jgi:hypothetical protein
VKLTHAAAPVVLAAAGWAALSAAPARSASGAPARARAAPSPAVCSDPAKPCPGFKPHDLSFPLPAGGKARPEARSAPFFAVILRTAERCRITEAERLEIQALFPANKVFTTRFECDDDPENNVTYTNVSPRHAFLAVHAGADRAAARKLLAHVQSLGRFPGANLRNMQVVFVYP